MFRLFPAPLLMLAVTQALAQTAPAAAATSAPDLSGSLWQLLLGLTLVLALVVASLWVLKKLFIQRGENAGLLRVVAGAAVGARERIVIVEVGSTWLVLGVAPGRVSALAEIPRQTIATATTGPSGQAGPRFADWLHKLAPGR